MPEAQSSPALATTSPAPEMPAELVWSFNPWLRHDQPLWRRPYYALAIELLIAAIAGYSFTYPHVWPDGLAWGGLSLLLLAGMTSALFLPVRYRLDQRGVAVYFAGTTSFRAWAHYRNYYAHDTGVHLTTLPTPSALDPFRGHFLQFSQRPDGATNREPVTAFIKAHIVAPEPPPPG